MSSHFGWLYLQLAGVAAGAALLCIACERDARTDARLWLAVAVVAATFFGVTQAGG